MDYSGAQTPTSSLSGLRVYVADHVTEPVEVLPPPSPRKYWTRKGIAEWLVEVLSDGPPTIVGIDHGFSFPLKYFDKYGIPRSWPEFLDDFQQHWPTDGEHVYVDFVRDGLCGNGNARIGDRRWRRPVEKRVRAKSVFHFDVQGTVAKSTHSGLPWLRYLRQQLGDKVHFWPYDGWDIPADRSVITEAYPALWSMTFPKEDRTQDQHDAYTLAAWMRLTDMSENLVSFFAPPLSPKERADASIEGWIIGVM